MLQAARMIESELKADPQFKSADKAEPKADKKAKAKGAASMFSADKDLTHLEKAWSETANENESHAKDPSGYHNLYWAFAKE